MRVVYYTSKKVEATSDLKAVTQELTLLSLKSLTDGWVFEKMIAKVSSILLGRATTAAAGCLKYIVLMLTVSC